ncbi:putative methylaconitate Delta-isomerase PrpF, partial [Escherichia coli]|nr:putative methylaconitate Delta-isomerase PrpF [Escherichia coli]
EDPADGEGAMFPTGNLVDTLDGPDGPIEATLINAGIPAVFVNATDLGYTGAELREALNSDPAALERFEALRTAGATRMGIAKTGRAPAI